jgi:hypothetical protein
MFRCAVLSLAFTFILPPGWCCWRPRLGVASGESVAATCPKCCHRATSDSKQGPNGPSPNGDHHCPCQTRVAVLLATDAHLSKILDNQLGFFSFRHLFTISEIVAPIGLNRHSCLHSSVRHQALFCIWRC